MKCWCDVQELAWCTYSLVCNVNCTCVLIVDGDNEVIGARGSFGQSSLLSKQPADNLSLFTKVTLQSGHMLHRLVLMCVSSHIFCGQ